MVSVCVNDVSRWYGMVWYGFIEATYTTGEKMIHETSIKTGNQSAKADNMFVMLALIKYKNEQTSTYKELTCSWCH